MLATVGRQRHGVAVLTMSAPAVARVLLYGGVAVAVARAPADWAALVRAKLAVHAITAHGTVALHFGPKTAAAGSLSGAVGWLGALLATALGNIPFGLTLTTVGLALMTLALVELRAAHFSNSGVAVVAACITALCLCEAAHAGGPLIAPLLLAAFLALLDRPTLRNALCATGLAIAWCNLSPSGLFAGMFGLAVAVGASLDRRTAVERIRSWVAALGACAASMATPAGVAYPLLAFHALRIDGRLARLSDVAPYASAPIAYDAGLMLVLMLGLGLGLRALGLAGVLPAMLALVLGFANGENVPLVGVVAAPLLAAAARDLRAAAWPRIMLPLTLLVAIVGNVAARDRAGQSALTSSAATLARRAASMPTVRRLFCAQPAWCTFAVAAGGHVLIDDRIAVAPADVDAAQIGIATASARWPALAKRYRIDAMLVGTDSTLASLLRLTRTWRTDVVRGDTALFVRRSLDT